MPRQHHLHLEVVSVEVHPELERAEELPVGVVARELDCERQVEVRGRGRGGVREDVLVTRRVVLVQPPSILRQPLVVGEDELLGRLGGARLPALQRVEQVRVLREQPGVRLRPEVARRVEALIVPRARRPRALPGRRQPSGRHRRPASGRERCQRQRVVRVRCKRPRLTQCRWNLAGISLGHSSVPLRAVCRPDHVERCCQLARRLGNALRSRGTEARYERAREASSLGGGERGPWGREDLSQLRHLGAMHSPHLLKGARLPLEALGWPGQRRHGSALAYLEAATHPQRLVDLVTLGAVEDRVDTRETGEAVEEAVPAVCRHRCHRVLLAPLELAEPSPHGAGRAHEPGRYQTDRKPVGAASVGGREPLSGHVVGCEPTRLTLEERWRPARCRGRCPLHRRRAHEGTWRHTPPHPATCWQQQGGSRRGRDRQHVEDDLGRQRQW